MDHATNIITKGIISNSGLILSTKGYIPIFIEEVKPKKGGHSGQYRLREKHKKLELDQKCIKVTAIIDGKPYTQFKTVHKNTQVTLNDIEIKFGEEPKIIINIDKD